MASSCRLKTIPGVHPLQEEACADEPGKGDRTFSPVLHSTETPNQLWHRSTANRLVQSLGSTAEAPSIISEPVPSIRCFSWYLLLLCLWRLLLGRGMQNIPPPTPETAIASFSAALAGCFGRAGTQRTQCRGTNLCQPPHGSSRL